jgi:hypothetical protein
MVIFSSLVHLFIYFLLVELGERGEGWGYDEVKEAA